MLDNVQSSSMILIALLLQKFHSASPHEIVPIFNVTLMIFILNFTATRAITSTNLIFIAASFDIPGYCFRYTYKFCCIVEKLKNWRLKDKDFDATIRLRLSSLVCWSVPLVSILDH